MVVHLRLGDDQAGYLRLLLRPDLLKPRVPTVRYLQTADGRRSIPLIVEAGTCEREAVAFKTRLGPVDDTVVADLLWLRRKLGDRLVDAVVLTTTPQAYRRRDGIAVVPLGLLGP